MILEMYSVFDKKTGAFTPPQMFRARGEAIRSFSDAVGDGNSPFSKHAEDYAFAYIGSFDDNSGCMTFPKEGPEFVIQAVQCVTPF